MSKTDTGFLKANLPSIVKSVCALIMAAAFFMPYVSLTLPYMNVIGSVSPQGADLKNMSIVQLFYNQEVYSGYIQLYEVETAVIYSLGLLAFAAVVFVIFLTFWNEPIFAIICDAIGVMAMVGIQIAIGAPDKLFPALSSRLGSMGSMAGTYTYGIGYYLFIAAALGNIVGNIMMIFRNKNSTQKPKDYYI